MTHDKNNKSTNRSSLDTAICKELVVILKGVIGLSSTTFKNDKNEEVPVNTFQVILSLPKGKDEEIFDPEKQQLPVVVVPELNQSISTDFANVIIILLLLLLLLLLYYC